MKKLLKIALMGCVFFSGCRNMQYKTIGISYADVVDGYVVSVTEYANYSTVIIMGKGGRIIASDKNNDGDFGDKEEIKVFNGLESGLDKYTNPKEIERIREIVGKKF